MIPLQDHVRSLVEHIEYVSLVVLATQTEQESFVRQLHHVLLHPLPDCRDPDTFDPVFTNDPTPDRVVAVEDDYLIGQTRKSMNLPSQNRSQGGVEERRIGDMTELVPLRVVS